MLLSNLSVKVSMKRFYTSLAIASAMLLSACQFQPLYGNNNTVSGGQDTQLAAIEVSRAYSRVGQQARNHLIFLLTGGNPSPQKTHEARIRVNYNNNVLAAINDPTIRDSSAGTITVTISYDLIDNSTGKSIATGTREASASYDRTGQVFANERAERDAEDRAAREAAEAVRLAIASDLKRV